MANQIVSVLSDIRVKDASLELLSTALTKLDSHGRSPISYAVARYGQTSLDEQSIYSSLTQLLGLSLKRTMSNDQWMSFQSQSATFIDSHLLGEKDIAAEYSSPLDSGGWARGKLSEEWTSDSDRCDIGS